MYIVFVGDNRYNRGPSNVNREIIRHKGKHVLHIDFTHRFGKILGVFAKTVIAKVVVVSGVSRFNCFSMKLAKKMGKKTVYIMHGCAEYEAMIDGRKVENAAGLQRERELLRYADLLLPVSEKYSNWIKLRYPQYADKTGHWQVGVESVTVGEDAGERQKNSVSASGGDWVLKKNAVIAEAVERLNGAVHLTVYGPFEDHDLVGRTPHTKWAGTVDHKQFLHELKSKELFVVNSVIESFNLSVMEALVCGCSILVSNNVGASGIMQLTDQDIIFDTDDVDEITEKMLYLLQHPNNRRIMQTIDWESLKHESAVRRLEEICETLAKDKE